MNKDNLNRLLRSVAEGRLSAEEASEKLRHIAYEDIEYAHVDHHRSLRKGFPEVIFGQGKTAEQVIGIIEKVSLTSSHDKTIELKAKIDTGAGISAIDEDLAATLGFGSAINYYKTFWS